MDGPFARPLPGSLDLIWWLLDPLHARLAALLLQSGLPAVATSAIVELIMWAEVLAVGVAVVRLTRFLREPGRLTAPVQLAAALSAAALIATTVNATITKNAYVERLVPGTECTPVRTTFSVGN